MLSWHCRSVQFPLRNELAKTLRKKFKCARREADDGDEVREGELGSRDTPAAFIGQAYKKSREAGTEIRFYQSRLFHLASVLMITSMRDFGSPTVHSLNHPYRPQTSHIYQPTILRGIRHNDNKKWSV